VLTSKRARNRQRHSSFFPESSHRPLFSLLLFRPSLSNRGTKLFSDSASSDRLINPVKVSSPNVENKLIYNPFRDAEPESSALSFLLLSFPPGAASHATNFTILKNIANFRKTARKYKHIVRNFLDQRQLIIILTTILNSLLLEDR
jgi:hypothetical protein